MAENEKNNLEETENIENNTNTEEIAETVETTETAEPIEPIETSEPIDPVEENESNENNEENAEFPEVLDIQTPQLPEFSKTKKPGTPFKESVFGITVILGTISVVMAFVLALLNSITAPVIAQRLADEKNEAVASLFGEGAESETLEGFEDIYLNYDAPIKEVETVKYNQSPKIAGYCVTVTPQGFGGQIIMLVAVNPDITVRDAKILSMSETSGLGTKIGSEEWFGKQFKNKQKNIRDSKTDVPSGENAIKVIAGATRSSKAYLTGVNAALDVAGEISRRLNGTSESDEITEDTDESDESEEGEGIDE